MRRTTPMPPVRCHICGKLFIPRSILGKYCNDCRARILKEYTAYVENHKPRTTCIVCGSTIDRNVYHSDTVCSRACGRTLFATTDKWRRTHRRGKAKRAYHRLYELNTPKKRKPLKIKSHLGQDIQEARNRGLEYGAYMALKKWGGALRW